jgi:hypothetical protein
MILFFFLCTNKNPARRRTGRGPRRRYRPLATWSISFVQYSDATEAKLKTKNLKKYIFSTTVLTKQITGTIFTKKNNLSWDDSVPFARSTVFAEKYIYIYGGLCSILHLQSFLTLVKSFRKATSLNQNNIPCSLKDGGNWNRWKTYIIQ